MSANVIVFPKRIKPDASSRAVDEHLLIALEQRDRLLAEGAVNAVYLDFACVQAAIEGAAEYLRSENPNMTDTGLARRLGEIMLFYCRTKLGVEK